MPDKDTLALLPCPFCGSSDIDPEGVASFKPEFRGVEGLTWENGKPEQIEHRPACNDCSATTNGDWNTRAANELAADNAALERENEVLNHRLMHAKLIRQQLQNIVGAIENSVEKSNGRI